MVSKIQYRCAARLCLSRPLGCLFVLALLLAMSGPAIASPGAPDSPNASENKQSLHRLDFRLEGKSCAACLLSIQRKLNSLPGVKEAVVMLKRPYGVSVIYQTSQMKADEILTIIKEKEPNVKIFEVSDTGTGSIPSPLIPPFVPVIETSH